MENASKALLIAGSILIVILLIAVGMMVFGGAQSNIEGSIASMNSQEKEAFNSQFTMYQGTKKSATNTKTLLNKLIANNTNPDTHHVLIYADSEKFIRGKFNSKDITNVDTSDSVDSNLISQLLGKITTSKTYDIVFHYTDGLITGVCLFENDGTTHTDQIDVSDD